MALILQFAVRKYVAWVYWLLVVMVAIFGTMVADVTHIVLGVPYYLSTITFAMGTATGDMTAITLHLGYLASGILFAVLFLLPAVDYFAFRLNGLGYGDGMVSGVLVVFIVILVGYLTVSRKDMPSESVAMSGKSTVIPSDS